MEFTGTVFAMTIIGLVIGIGIGVLIAPEYISLEEMQTNSYIAQLEAKDLVLEQSIEEWTAYSEDVKEFEINECSKQKSEMVERLTGRNNELIVSVDLCLEKFSDLNKAIVDLNTTIGDINIMDVNCRR